MPEKRYSLAPKVVCHTKSPDNTSHCPGKLPVQLAFTVLLICAVSNSNSRNSPNDGVANNNWVVSVLTQLPAILLQGILDLLALRSGPLLSFICRIGSLSSFSTGFVFELVLNSLRLGLCLDSLFLEIRLDGTDVGGVDID